MVDNITKERFDLTSGMLVFAGSIRSLTSSEEWLKYEELQYIYSEIRAFDGRRGARYQELLKIRKKRVEEKERKRLTEVYK